MFNNEHRNEKKDQIKHLIRPISFPNEELSRIVDLREWMSPVEHQQDMNTW